MVNIDGVIVSGFEINPIANPSVPYMVTPPPDVIEYQIQNNIQDALAWEVEVIINLDFHVATGEFYFLV